MFAGIVNLARKTIQNDSKQHKTIQNNTKQDHCFPSFFASEKQHDFICNSCFHGNNCLFLTSTEFVP